MLSSKELAQILFDANEEWDTDEALQGLLQVAVDVTKSHNALFARMNDDLGAMQITQGAGKDWKDDMAGLRIQLNSGDGIVGAVAVRGESYVAENVAEEPHYQNLFGSSRSEAAVPIADRHGRIRAVLNVESDVEGHYGEGHLGDLEALAGVAGMVIARDELLRREEALFAVGHASDRAHTEAELLNRVMSATAEVLRYSSCAIYLWDEVRAEFVLRASSGGLRHQVGLIGYRGGEGLTGWVAAYGKPVRLANPQLDSRWVGKALEIPVDQIAGYLAVPILLRGEPAGVIRVIRRENEIEHYDNQFTEDDERILEAIAEQVAAGIEGIRALNRLVRIERMAAWGELSAKSSHMIGNRVFALRGDVNELGHLLAEKPLPIDDIQAIHKSLLNNLVRVEEILQEFRDFLTATQLALIPLDLNALVQEAVTEVFPRRSKVTLTSTSNLSSAKSNSTRARCAAPSPRWSRIR